MDFVKYIRYRFSVSDSNFDNILSYTFWICRCISINIDSTCKNDYGTLFRWFCYSGILLGVYLYVISAVYYLVSVFQETSDYAAAVVVIGTSFTSSIVTLKYVYVLIYRKELIEAIDQYRSVNAIWKPSSRHWARSSAHLRTVKKRCVGCFLGLTGNSLMFCLKPFMLPGRHWPVDELVLWGFVPKHATPNHEIGQALFVIGAYMSTMVPTAITILFIFLVGYIEAHILGLSEEFRHLWRDSKRAFIPGEGNLKILTVKFVSLEYADTVNERIRKKLKDLIYKHVRLLKLFNIVSSIFGTMIFMELGLTFFALFSIFLGGVENAVFVMLFSMSLLLMNCMLGQKLTNASSDFEKSVYDCGWENFDSKNMKSILVVLQRSQKELTLTIGGVMNLSLAGFYSIVKSIYSAYATFQRNMKKKRSRVE